MTKTFIIGAPRSGTTLVQSIVASHSRFRSPPETYFFVDIIPKLGVLYANPDHPIDSDDIALIVRTLEQKLGESKFVEPRLQAGMTVKEAFEEIVNSGSTGEGQYWVEKTTNHATTMLLIQRFYSDAKFIHILRDPVDCVASMRNIRPLAIDDYRILYLSAFYTFSKIWLRCVSLAFAYPYQQNVLHIRYEELVENPEHQIKKICAFLNMKFEENQVSSFHETAETLFSTTGSPWQNSNLQPGFNRASIHKWRRILPKRKVWLVQYYLSKLSASLGYYETKYEVSRLVRLYVLGCDLGLYLIQKSALELIFRRAYCKIYHP